MANFEARSLKEIQRPEGPLLNRRRVLPALAANVCFPPKCSLRLTSPSCSVNEKVRNADSRVRGDNAHRPPPGLGARHEAAESGAQGLCGPNVGWSACPFRKSAAQVIDVAADKVICHLSVYSE